MDFFDVIKERRSVRKYKENTPVERSVVEEILMDAQLAPSWKNSQTARYYVVMGEEKLKRVKDNCLMEYNQNNCRFAPVLIVTTYVKNVAGFEKDGTPTNEFGNGWGAYDLGLQNENLVLSARARGLDTLVMGIRKADKLREELSIPQDEEVVSVISLGYRDIEPQMPKRKDLSEVAKFF